MYKIDELTALKLKGKRYDDNTLYNPVQDKAGQWYLGNLEVEKIVKTEFKTDIEQFKTAANKVTDATYKLTEKTILDYNKPK
jgi:hypothetical protein